MVQVHSSSPSEKTSNDSGLFFFGGIAQLVRAFASHARGPGFESLCLHQRKSTVRDYGGLFSYPFYGTDGDAFNKILLHEGIEQDDRAGGYAGEGEFHGLAGG